MCKGHECCMEGASLKTIKVRRCCRLSSLSSLSAREHKPCLTSCEASQGRTSFLRILFSAAATAVNLQRGLIRQVPFWTASTLQTSRNHHCHSSMLLFFPPKLAFSSILAPRPPHAALTFLQGRFSSGNLSKGCVRAIKNFPFCFIASLNIPDKAREGRGWGREGGVWLICPGEGGAGEGDTGRRQRRSSHQLLGPCRDNKQTLVCLAWPLPTQPQLPFTKPHTAFKPAPNDCPQLEIAYSTKDTVRHRHQGIK